MGLIQRAARALKRTAPPDPARREPVVSQRSFSMAAQSRLNSSWGRRTSNSDANTAIYRDHETLRQRAREQSINSGYAKRFYRLLKQNVIGPHGIHLQSKAEKPDGTPDTAQRRAIEREWAKWCKRGQCDVTGRYSFTTFLHLWIETLARDGEVLVRLVRNWPNRWGFALQILEADRLDANLNTWLSNGNRVRMGVELDAWERPVAYWLKHDHPGDNYRTPGAQDYDRVPADEMRHTFEPWRPHQSRGFTWTHAGANDLHHIEEYSGAELIAAEAGAKITGVYEQDAEWIDPPEDSADDGTIFEEIEAGTNRLLPYGLKWKPFDNKHPSTNFAPFTKAAVRKMAAAFGPSYNRLAHDLEGVSFSSLRSGELDERDFYKCAQQFVISELLELVGEAWLSTSALSGALRLPPRHFERLSAVDWLPRGWDWVDPLKDSKAAQVGIDSKTKTRSAIIRQNGQDPEEVFAELAAEEALLKRLGLTTTPSQPPQEAPADGEDEEEDADD